MNVQDVKSILEGLSEQVDSVQASALISTDGLILASAFPENVDEDVTGAMSAALLALGKKIGKELSRGALEQVFLQSTNGCTILFLVNEDAILVVLTDRDVKIGLLSSEIKHTLDKIRVSII